MEAKVIFNDGTELDAEMNGSCLIVDEEPVFPEDLTNVSVQTENGTTVYNNALLVVAASVDGRFWFSFSEEPVNERVIRELREDVEDALNGLLEFILEGEDEGNG